MSYQAFQQTVLGAMRRRAPESSLLAVHPYVAFKAFQRSRSFRHEELDHLVQGLADIDLRIKTTAEDGFRALQLFLLGHLGRA
jgi:DNA polymerase III delta subunit